MTCHRTLPTPRPDALPDAAWFAEHAMGWQKAQRPIAGDIMSYAAWVDRAGEFQAWVVTWNPLANEADAMQLLMHCDNWQVLRNGDWYTITLPYRTVFPAVPKVHRDSQVCLVICRAVAAWVRTREKI